MLEMFTVSVSPVDIFVLKKPKCDVLYQNSERNSPDYKNDTKWFTLKRSLSRILSNQDETDSPLHVETCQEKEEMCCQSQCVSLQNSPSSHLSNSDWLDYPYFTDKDTINLIRQSKIMFLMRGLSGSGKSTIVKKLQTIYHDNVVCSADNFFFDDQGFYNFNADKLNYAHELCQGMARTSCQNGTKTVIIDNTHVKYWEAQFYFKIASTNNYIVIVVTPKTPWSFDPEQLCIRNKHGVDLMTIHRKLNQFQDFIPFYYGWFLNESLSSVLLSMGMEYLKECIELYPIFKLNLLSRSSDDNILKDYFTRYRNRQIVHCTAKYIGKGRQEGGREYHNRVDVQSAYGYSFTIILFGFTITGKTLGARVQLAKEALDLYDKPEEFQRDFKRSSTNVLPSKSAKSKIRQSNGKSSAHVSSGQCSSPTKNIPAITKLYPFVRPTAHGRSAHITLGTAYEIPSKETNYDLLDICDLEVNATANPDDFQTVKGGKSRCFDEDHCCIYLDKPYKLSVIFTGCY